MTRRRLLAAAAAVGLFAGWYFFRPDRAFTSRTVEEPAPPGATALLAGRFEPRAHEGRGRAIVLSLPDGRRQLRFEDFATLDGPDLQVYLLADSAANGRAGLTAGYVSLGALKGNVGPQNYDIPGSVDLGRYAAVAVWCRRFGVNFTTASLRAAAARGTTPLRPGASA